MKYFLIASSILVAHSVAESWEYFSGTGFLYQVHHSDPGLDYWEARKYCHTQDADLASIHSSTENQFIYNLAKGGRFHGGNWEIMTLIGLKLDHSPNRAWAWSDNSVQNLTIWEKGEPNHHITGEECTLIFTTVEGSYGEFRGNWFDVGCERKFERVVCKKPGVTNPTKSPIPHVECSGSSYQGFFIFAILMILAGGAYYIVKRKGVKSVITSFSILNDSLLFHDPSTSNVTSEDPVRRSQKNDPPAYQEC